MSEYDLSYYLWILLLLGGAVVAWTLNFVALPGNWLIVGLGVLFVANHTGLQQGSRLDWEAVGLLAAMAAAGELLETMAGAYGAGKRGGSRRAMVLAIFGTLAGSITGAVAGLPVPVAGPLFGALAGGAAGAFAGAWLGEMWKHGGSDKGISVGWGAAIGRLLGTAGKLAVGALMVVVLAVRAFS